jgi:hypothetical protein
MAMKPAIKSKIGVIDAWTQRNAARTSNNSMKTARGCLWSYGLQIGFTSADGVRFVGDFTSGGGEHHSHTTSCHVGLAKSVAAEVVHPEVFKTMVPDWSWSSQDR